MLAPRVSATAGADSHVHSPHPFAFSGRAAGLEVWRIENLAPVPVDTKLHGKFHVGDAYIVLKTIVEKSGALTWYAFFWLGDESSSDEQGAAALLTVELDTKLGGGPVQSREVQGLESDRFMQCFTAVEYLAGGVDSGFKHVERGVYEKRLLRLKGARMVRVTTVPMSASSLNAGDVFILDLGLEIYQWNGSASNKKERAKGLDVAISIKDDERGGKARILPVAQGDEPEEFWAALGGRGPVAPAIDDAPAPAPSGGGGIMKLFKVSDASGKLETTEVAAGSLMRSMLVTDDVFILDNGSDITVWVGKRATEQERRGGLATGSAYAEQAGRPKGTRVVKVAEGAEPTTFKANFEVWDAWLLPSALASSKEHSPSLSERVRGNVATSGAKRDSIDVASDVAGSPQLSLMHRQSMRADVVDQPDGHVSVWRIEGFAKVAVPIDSYGQFHAGDSYIVQNSYLKGSKQLHTIYYWLGLGSSSDEKGAAALLTKQMDEELGGAATQVRVVMGKEPLHFIGLFKGKMIVRSGGKASSFRNRQDADSYDMDGISLFHVRGTDEYDTRAVQVPETAPSLNSGDCFVLLTPDIMYVWKGEGANESEVETATKIAEILRETRTLTPLDEGEEPPGFWSALGGKGEYPKAIGLPEASREPMLFCCSNATGTHKLEPIFDFGQIDLEEEDVFLLDSFTTIWVWIGSQSNSEESTMGVEVAQAYIKQQNYDELTPIVRVHSRSEPPMFTCHFLGWDASLNQAFVDPYAAKLAAIAAKEQQKIEDVPMGLDLSSVTPIRPSLLRSSSSGRSSIGGASATSARGTLSTPKDSLATSEAMGTLSTQKESPAFAAVSLRRSSRTGALESPRPAGAEPTASPAEVAKSKLRRTSSFDRDGEILQSPRPAVSSSGPNSIGGAPATSEATAPPLADLKSKLQPTLSFERKVSTGRRYDRAGNLIVTADGEQPIATTEPTASLADIKSKLRPTQSFERKASTGRHTIAVNGAGTVEKRVAVDGAVAKAVLVANGAPPTCIPGKTLTVAQFIGFSSLSQARPISTVSPHTLEAAVKSSVPAAPPAATSSPNVAATWIRGGDIKQPSALEKEETKMPEAAKGLKAAEAVDVGYEGETVLRSATLPPASTVNQSDTLLASTAVQRVVRAAELEAEMHRLEAALAAAAEKEQAAKKAAVAAEKRTRERSASTANMSIGCSVDTSTAAISPEISEISEISKISGWLAPIAIGLGTRADIHQVRDWLSPRSAVSTSSPATCQTPLPTRHTSSQLKESPNQALPSPSPSGPNQALPSPSSSGPSPLAVAAAWIADAMGGGGEQAARGRLARSASFGSEHLASPPPQAKKLVRSASFESSPPPKGGCSADDSLSPKASCTEAGFIMMFSQVSGAMPSAQPSDINKNAPPPPPPPPPRKTSEISGEVSEIAISDRKTSEISETAPLTAKDPLTTEISPLEIPFLRSRAPLEVTEIQLEVTALADTRCTPPEPPLRAWEALAVRSSRPPQLRAWEALAAADPGAAAEAIAALPDDQAQALHTAVTEAAVAAAQQTQQRQQTPSAPSPPLRLVRRMGALARGAASPVTGGSPVAVEPLSPPSNGNDGVPFPPRFPPASAAAAAGGEPISVSLMQKTRFVMTKLGLSGTMPAVAVEAAEHLGVDTTGKNTAAVLNECYRELLGDLAV
jgi:hypothetical protein